MVKSALGLFVSILFLQFGIAQAFAADDSSADDVQAT